MAAEFVRWAEQQTNNEGGFGELETTRVWPGEAKRRRRRVEEEERGKRGGGGEEDERMDGQQRNTSGIERRIYQARK